MSVLTRAQVRGAALCWHPPPLLAPPPTRQILIPCHLLGPPPTTHYPPRTTAHTSLGTPCQRGRAAPLSACRAAERMPCTDFVACVGHVAQVEKTVLQVWAQKETIIQTKDHAGASYMLAEEEAETRLFTLLVLSCRTHSTDAQSRSGSVVRNSSNSAAAAAAAVTAAVIEFRCNRCNHCDRCNRCNRCSVARAAPPATAVMTPVIEPRTVWARI